MGNCDSGVSSVIVCDSGVVCDGWSFCCALIHSVRLLQLHCLVFVYGQVVVLYYSEPPPKDVGSFWEVFFYVGASIYSLSGMVGNVANVLFWVVYSVYVTIFFHVACHYGFFCVKGDV